MNLMTKCFFLFMVSVIVMGYIRVCAQVKETYRDIYPDTWVATDALGRTMPDAEKVGPPKTDKQRVVGIFYITWHTDNAAKTSAPYTGDVTKILAQDTAARWDANHPLWKYGAYHWGEPELGYFLSKDEYVIRKDMSMLADAGVDVLVMDVTNAVHYWEQWEVLFTTMQQMKAEGNKVPQFCFWAFNGPVITVVQQLYDRIYKENKYKDLWFYWQGRPLILLNGDPSVDANGKGPDNPNPHYDSTAVTNKNHLHYGDPDYTEKFYKDYTKEVKNFFTTRTMWWGYYKWAGKRFVGTEDNWSFGYDLGNNQVRAMRPDSLLSTHKGKREQAAVTPGQHSSSLIGKSWSREKGQPALNEYDLPEPTFVPWLGKTVENPEGYGIYFQERWDEALQSDPEFIYINDWNEWTAGKYQPEGGKTTEFMQRNSPFFFVDQYNSEFNRAIQPMKGGYTDNYYMQMAQNIRRYKGARAMPEANHIAHIRIDGSFDDWKAITPEFRDTYGDVMHRDAPGYGGTHYVNKSGRNDIVTSKVAVDANSVYFFVETAQALTAHTDTNWMMLLIDADQDASTGWYGYDYLVNQDVVNDRHTSIMKYNGVRWTKLANIPYMYAGNAMEISIPRDVLQLKGNKTQFDFKWIDNPVELKDPISLCTEGDTAPNRRFNYRFIWNK